MKGKERHEEEKTPLRVVDPRTLDTDGKVRERQRKYEAWKKNIGSAGAAVASVQKRLEAAEKRLDDTAAELALRGETDKLPKEASEAALEVLVWDSLLVRLKAERQRISNQYQSPESPMPRYHVAGRKGEIFR